LYFREHWKKKHSESGQVPEEEATEIYDPKAYAKMILDGTPVDEVARSAFSQAQECLRELGKPNKIDDVLGRNETLRKWIHVPSSHLK